jgi:DNA-binding NarL/FixJ family response regulator
VTSAPTAQRGVWVDEQHPVVRRGMISVLTAEHIPVCGESAALQPIPDLLSTTVLIFDADGTGLSRTLALVGTTPVRLVATMRDPTGARLRELAGAGVCSILLQDDLTPDALVRTIRSVARGRTTLPHNLLMRLIEHAARTSAEPTGVLTTRERQVLQMLAEGEDTRSIANGLNYSERTVKNVVHDVLTKLNCRTRAQAVGMAMRAGVI